MATKTWNGSSGNYTDPASWSPAGAPISGDTAIINSGTVLAAGLTISGVTINLTQTGSAATSQLSLSSTTLGATSALNVNNPNAFNDTAPTIAIAGGVVENDGTATFTGTRVLVPTAAGSTLLNKGTLNFVQSSPQISGSGTLQNDGTIAFVRPVLTAQIPIVSTPITGSGTIELGINARLDLAASVAPTQTVRFNGGAGQNELLQLDQAANFNATIAGFSTSDLIAVINLPYTSANYISTGASSGTLNLLSGATVAASLNFTGSYSLGSFTFTYNDFGGGLSNLQIATSVNNAQFGNLPPGFGGGNALPVYRYFDKIYGTHFFTADVGERNTVNATRATSTGDFAQETNGFGAVAQSDANALPVFRFFDNKFGTHFFTSSTAERDNIVNTLTGSDKQFTYEGNSTFYEHGTQQAGDIAVYRLFDSRNGTQFLTGDQNEYAAITTPGNAAYRSDLRSEGVAFYAPTGSFT